MRIEERIIRWPRLKRPEGWVPEFGESVWYARGGHHLLEIVRVGLVIEADRYPIAVRAGTHGAMFHVDAPRSRLWPMKEWEEAREKRRREECEGEDDVVVLTMVS